MEQLCQCEECQEKKPWTKWDSFKDCAKTFLIAIPIAVLFVIFVLGFAMLANLPESEGVLKALLAVE